MISQTNVLRDVQLCKSHHPEEIATSEGTCLKFPSSAKHHLSCKKKKTQKKQQQQKKPRTHLIYCLPNSDYIYKPLENMLLSKPTIFLSYMTEWEDNTGSKLQSIQGMYVRPLLII